MRWYARMQTTITLLTEHLMFAEEPPHCFGALMEVHVPRVRARHYHDVDVVGQSCPVSAIDLPQIPFDAISHDGLADSARHSKSELPSLTFPPGHVTDERSAHPLRSVPEHRVVLCFASEPLSVGKRVLARHNKPITSRLSRQTFPSPRPAAPDHIASARSRHTGAKPVIALPLDVGWLKRAFHSWISFVAGLVPPQRAGPPRVTRYGSP